MTSLSVEALGAAADAVEAHLPVLVEEKFASRLFAQDATLWGPEAESEASIRLAWTGLHRSSRPLVGEIAALREELQTRGVHRIALCGMGGSSLAPEVICATAGVELVVVDSSDPDMVRSCVQDDLAGTAVVVSSKSGSTVETDSQRRIFVQAFVDAGIDPTERVIIVTDPGSAMDQQSRADGYRVINADPDVGGRYSALTAFGLVPSGLAGVDVGALLDEAEVVADLLAEDDSANPGLRLGAALGGTQPLRDKLILTDRGTPIVGFADWAEQLIAESTGKQGTGLLPVVVGTDGAAPAVAGAPDASVVALVADDDESPASEDVPSQINVSGTLGAQLLLWEVATAVAGRLLGINPFDQPDVESAKNAARELMADPSDATEAPLSTDGAVEIRTAGASLDLGTSADSLSAAVDTLLAQVDPDRGYLSVMVYLDRLAHADLAGVRDPLETRLGRPVTFGWGPRFLHSTGQFHKGGPEVGVYLQVTGEPVADLPVPGQEFTLGTFIAAQAAGDAKVLADAGRPVLRLHLADQEEGLAQLTAVLGSG
ncbi:glucose-6-phosphate isomerase [Ornithinimicrobium cryptoxanthini]|uniref:Glucose-6-phosphate isomerase n=1 Tax=Ornithinimicrobium cryptoxanthini TaxID=2934161 RepID=A0ABY4YDV5_9MICO|nr:glucose-6-phosphate isomerase [Ornithinimicrobium cryptoxanthini]USQ74919.1 glucose-6-phosphate isomerase [Ornithinimicrobium cryptoxanthini]